MLEVGVAYEEFGDIITFDTTYLTNKYDMPFAPFVGVNHHGHSILLGYQMKILTHLLGFFGLGSHV